MVKTKNIMVVDDEAGLRNLLFDILGQEGFQVTLACDGQDSWDQMKRKGFDLLITDIDMPRLDGIELLKKMQKRGREEKVLVMTGHCLDYEDIGCEFPRVYGLLRKPFRLSYFIENVTQIMDSPKPIKKETLLRANRRA